jgi:hypothetical protein
MTCRSRSLRSGVAVSLLVLFSAAASAAELPAIKVSETNQVAACATPGRLMSYLRERNPKLNPRYEMLASEYMRSGEELQVRWDYAFFQMLLETGYLTYGGDVRPDQNNFAGLGATGGGVRGERFKDISTGARAHLEHLLMYSGAHVENPVAERTRNIQEWDVLTSWQKSISGPITFTQLAKKWAPTSKRYAADISGIADRFFEGPCKEADPQPELVADIRGTPVKTVSAETPVKTRGLGTEKRATEEAAASDAPDRQAPGVVSGAAGQDDKFPTKGAAAVAAVASVATETKTEPQKASMSPPLTVLNANASADAPAVPPETVAEAPPAATTKPAKTKAAESTAGQAKAIEVAALPGALKGAGKVDKVEKSEKSEKPGKSDKAEKKAAPSAGAASGKCRVWTASYGGSKAIIIKAVQDKTVNYTVLDVNDGSEKREADAYINAYAKGGQSVGEFSSQSQALEKAFELCPEG